MTVLAVTPIYAGILTFLLIILSVRVISVRRAQGVSLGDGGDAELARRIRTHANFVEYAPMGLVLMVLAEGSGAAGMLLHGIGLALVVGRVSHAVSLAGEPSNIPLRTGGMALTFLALIAGAALNLYAAFV